MFWIHPTLIIDIIIICYYLHISIYYQNLDGGHYWVQQRWLENASAFEMTQKILQFFVFLTFIQVEDKKKEKIK